MKTESRRLAWAGIVLWLAAHGAQANVFVADRREQRDPALPLVRSVGVLHHRDSGAGGTAFLVGRCHIATAYHVAFARGRNPRTGVAEMSRAKLGHTADFAIGVDPKVASKFAAKTRARVVAYGDFSRSDFAGMAGDWAILQLDQCLGDRYGVLKTARPKAGTPMPEGELMTIGFPRSRASQAGVAVEVGCKARDHGPVAGLVGVDCAFGEGMSGAPVLQRQADGSWLVVGLVQQSMNEVERVLPEYSATYRNQMVTVDAFRKALDDALRAESRRVLEKRSG